MRALLATLTLTVALLSGCAATDSAEAPAAPAAAPAKKTCAVDADCGAGRICVKPEAAEYGFCL
ncbi:MAG: hypothetical protein KA754_10835 [Corallincola sp.]|nr:hypothetical protein [Corallincola sp.]